MNDNLPIFAVESNIESYLTSKKDLNKLNSKMPYHTYRVASRSVSYRSKANVYKIGLLQKHKSTPLKFKVDVYDKININSITGDKNDPVEESIFYSKYMAETY